LTPGPESWKPIGHDGAFFGAVRLAIRSAGGSERRLTSLAFTGSRIVTVSLAAGASFAATP
jgi:hypothetical protein